jgi:hypothetical protein
MRVLRGAFDDATKTAEGRAAILDAGRAGGISEQTIKGASLTVRKAEKLARVINDETIRRLHFSLMDSFSSLGSIGLSATPNSMTGSGSGSVNWLLNVVDAGTSAN